MSNTKPDYILEALAQGRTTDEMCDLFSNGWKEPPEAIYAGKATKKIPRGGGKAPRKTVPPKGK